MIFSPVRTYNCIIQLSKKVNKKFEYCIIKKTQNISEELFNAKFEYMDTDKLDVNRWALVDNKVLSNIKKIEGQFYSIRNLIKTGIATLRDEVYIVEYDGTNFYKLHNGIKFIIEPSMVKKLYKVPDLKNSTNINDRYKYIIFPYEKSLFGLDIIKEKDLQKQAPLTYLYLKERKDVLDQRDKGKPNPIAWYAYGRSQGLNKLGSKLLFPTFSNLPKFILVDDESALFCNGYAIFESDFIDLQILCRILNSYIMHYYISNTSYSIDGGFFCYQKKYLEKFTIPQFTSNEIDLIKSMTQEQLDTFLINKYELIL